MSEENALLYEQFGKVVKLTLNRPTKRNAMNHAIIQGLHDAFDRIAVDDRVSVVVIGGAGEKAFTAGFDLKEAAGADITDVMERRADTRNENKLWMKMWNLHKPIITMIHGYTIGGVDLRHIRRSDLRRHIGLVLQEPFLFSQTIGENIRAVRPDAPEDAMRRAAAIACVDDAVTSFPEGYDTIVGERGVTLSGGQKQRVAIARMLMQQAPVMIFDDSLSAVDAETDEKIRTALRRSTGNATVLLISHRVTTLMQADRILVLDGGRVAELGTHAQLVEKPGIYRDIYNIQMQSADRALLEEGGSEHGSH